MDLHDQLASRVGGSLGASAWRTVTPEHVAMFADATGAHEWIHLDAERARRESPFGGPVAHGYLTLSLATPFVTQLLDLDPGVLGVNYGLERVRFPGVVPVGSRVRAQGTLVDVAPAVTGVRTTIRLVYEVEGHDGPPCVAEVVSLLQPPT